MARYIISLNTLHFIRHDFKCRFAAYQECQKLKLDKAVGEALIFLYLHVVQLKHGCPDNLNRFETWSGVSYPSIAI